MINDEQNCTYFILPTDIRDPEKLKRFLDGRTEWQEEQEAFPLQYTLQYASRMAKPGDNRLRVYRYTSGKTLPVCMQSEKLKKSSASESRPELGEIMLYIFGCGVAFLEFRVVYGEMYFDEIVEFVAWFRSLRNNESSGHIQEGTISLETAARQILPEDESGTIHCFSNPSDLKRQANIYTILKHEKLRKEEIEREKVSRKEEARAKRAGYDEAELELLRRYRDKLTHGYRGYKTVADISETSDYKMCLDLPQKKEFWGGSQDGLVCISKEQWYSNLTVDYHFQYLLLLTQRSSAIRCIDRLSSLDCSNRSRLMDQYDQVKEINCNLIDIKTRYLFRVISDEFFVQNIYSRMYHVLEIEDLFRDLEDINDQLRYIQQEEQQLAQEETKKQEEKLETLLGVVSLLAVFSALVDLAAYLIMWTKGEELPFAVGSLVIVLAWLIIGLCILSKIIDVIRRAFHRRAEPKGRSL